MGYSVSIGLGPIESARDGSAARFASGPVVLQVAPADAPRGRRQVSAGPKIEEQPVYGIVDWETRVSASYSQAKRIHVALADTPPPTHPAKPN